jgi:hypothetical protein
LTEVDVSSTLKKKLEGGVEVAAIDPVASMQAIDNPNLKKWPKRFEACSCARSTACKHRSRIATGPEGLAYSSKVSWRDDSRFSSCSNRFARMPKIVMTLNAG